MFKSLYFKRHKFVGGHSTMLNEWPLGGSLRNHVILYLKEALKVILSQSFPFFCSLKSEGIWRTALEPPPFFFCFPDQHYFFHLHCFQLIWYKGIKIANLLVFWYTKEVLLTSNFKTLLHTKWQGRFGVFLFVCLFVLIVWNLIILRKSRNLS